MGTDKALLNFEGELLVVRVARRLQAVADPVMLAPGRRGRFRDLGYAEVDDEFPDAGPLSGLVAGLDVSPHEQLALVAVDMPHASPELFQLLAALRLDEDAVVPVSVDGIEPLHAVYWRQALPRVRSALAGGCRTMREVLSQLRVRYVDEEQCRTADPSGRWALNLNDIDDLDAILGAG